MGKNDAKYLYCLIETPQDKQYTSHGVSGSYPVYTIMHKDIAAVISDIEKDVIKVSAEECLLHEKVLKEVMAGDTMLPFEFGTVSPSREAVIRLLKDNHLNIKKSINRLRDKVEMNVNAVWANMDKMFQEIVSENRHIALYKKEIQKKSLEKTYQDRIKIGQLVAQVLYVKKEKEMYSIVTALKRNSVEYAAEKIAGDSMIFNGAFLVKKVNLEKFESTLYRLGDKLDGRINFTYSGPLVPYNFTNLKLKIRG